MLLGFSKKISVAARDRICARLMAISSPFITWDLNIPAKLWVYNGTLLPNPSGNKGVTVCVCKYQENLLNYAKVIFFLRKAMVFVGLDFHSDDVAVIDYL